MAKLSRYFTPALSCRDRERVLKLLGLKKFGFQLVEENPQQKLLVQLWSESGSKTEILETSSVQEKLQIDRYEERGVPRVSVCHLASVCDLGSGVLVQGIFEQLVPYPYSLLFKNQKKQFNVRFSPADFSQEVQRLQSAVQQLENRLSDFELSVLWLQDSQESFPLLCHFVRKKLLRVGSLPSLGGLCEKFEKGELTPVDLRQFFGTNAAFFHLKVNHFEELSSVSVFPLDSLVLAINQSLIQPNSHVIGEPLANLEPSPFLEIEL